MKTKNNPYPYLVALAFVAPVYVWLVVGCPGLTIDNSVHYDIQQEKILVKDTAEVKRWKAESKRFEKSAYDYQQKYYAKCREVKELKQVKFVEPKREVAQVQTQTRNAFPIVAEYNARTDKWPIGTGKNYTEARNKHNKEWEDLPHRASEDSLFKPK